MLKAGTLGGPHVPFLSHEEFQATFAAPMQRRSTDEEPPVEFWSYFDAIPAEDFFGRQCSGVVTYIYRDATSRFEHILVDTDNPNVFMAIVVALQPARILAHRLLDLNAEYGLVTNLN